MGQGRKARAAQETQSSNPDSREQSKVRRKSIRLKDSAEAPSKAEEPAGKRKRGKVGTNEQATPAKKQHGMQQGASTGGPALPSAPEEPQPQADGAAAVTAEPCKADTPSDSREAQCKGSLALQSTPPGAEGRSSRNEEPNAAEALGDFWGCLISLLPQHPSIEMSSTTMFGRGSECNVRLDDPRMPAKLFRIKMDADSDQACLRNFGAIPGQANPLISVNGRFLSQSEEVTLRGGDDVVVHSRHPYAFVYATPAELNAHKQAKPADAAPADKAAEEAMQEAEEAEPGAVPEPETELPADLLEAFQEGLARLAHKDPEAAPSGLAAADEAGPPGPGPAPEDEQHAADANAADHHLHVLAEACYNHSGEAGGSGVADGGCPAHVQNDPRGDPSADAPDPEQAPKLGGDNFLAMVAAGEGRPTVVLPSRGPGQGMPVLPAQASPAGPPPTRRGKGPARSAQAAGKSIALASRAGSMRASAMPAPTLRMWLPGLGPSSQGRGPPADLVSYLTWAASHAPPVGGPLHIPGSGRHPAKGIPKLGHPKGKGVTKPKARAPTAPPPTSPRRKRARKAGMDLRSHRPGVPTGSQAPSANAKASEEEVLREALGGLAKQASEGSAEPMDTSGTPATTSEAMVGDAGAAHAPSTLAAALVRDTSSPHPIAANTLVERLLNASSAGPSGSQPDATQPMATPMEAAAAAEQPAAHATAAEPAAASGEAAAAAGVARALEAAAAAEEAAKAAERAKYAPTVVDCTSPAYHKSRLKYWVGDGAWEVLRRTAQLHLKHPQGAKCLGFEEGLIFKGASQFVLLSGPTHSELCQEACLRAVAHEMGAQLMVTDCSQLCPDGSWRLPYMTAHSHVNHGPWVVQPDAVDGDGMDEDEWDAYEEELDWAASAGLPPPPAPGGTAYPGYPPANPYAPPFFLQSSPYKLGDRVFWTHHGSQAAPADQAALQPADMPGQPPPARSPSRTLASVLRFVRSARGGEAASAKALSARKSLVAQLAQPPAHPAPVPGSLPVPGPPAGSSGTVLIIFPDNPQRVGVRFDTPFPGGVNLGGQCGEGEGAICMTSCLQAGEGSSSAGPEGSQEELPSALDIVFNTAIQACITKPTILLLKSARSVMSNATDQSEGYNHFSACLDRAEQPLEEGAPTHKLLVVASMTQASKTGPKAFEGSGAFLSAMFSGGAGDALAIDGIPKDGKDRVRVRSEAKATEHLRVLFPNQIKLTAPASQPQLGKWRRQMEEDGALSRAVSNRHTLQNVVERCHIGCSQLSKLSYQEQKLDREAAERLVAWAIAAQLEAHPEQTALIQLHEHQCEFDLQLCHLQAALEVLKTTQEAEAVSKKATLDVQTDNDFEKKLLAEVIPPGEVGIGFGDIGALDNVKSTLREVVMLPLKRPELFMRGQLTKPTKGVLLFGPPGTGKTMLAKAVASESGANFISVGPSSLGSKWFGEAEKYVKALFTLAHKISPCVIFVDEVDSLLGRRDKSGEHEAMRKMKTEFMAAWDGLRTNQYDRVLVLAATNRPGDLDEAVVRRMPRRLMVDLPDAANRAKILKVILKEEQLEPGFSAEEVAGLTDGYSGSDLKNLCIAAAYRPIRDFLASEDAAGPADLDVSTSGAEPPAAKTGDAPGLTPPTQAAAELARQSAGEEGPVPASSGGTPQDPAEAADEAADADDGELKAADLRALTVKDFQEAMKQVGSSASEDAFSMGELKQWNEMYGEGGSRRSKLLSYFS